MATQPPVDDRNDDNNPTPPGDDHIAPISIVEEMKNNPPPLPVDTPGDRQHSGQHLQGMLLQQAWREHVQLPLSAADHLAELGARPADVGAREEQPALGGTLLERLARAAGRAEAPNAPNARTA